MYKSYAEVRHVNWEHCEYRLKHHHIMVIGTLRVVETAQRESEEKRVLEYQNFRLSGKKKGLQRGLRRKPKEHYEIPKKVARKEWLIA